LSDKSTAKAEATLLQIPNAWGGYDICPRNFKIRSSETTAGPEASD